MKGAKFVSNVFVTIFDQNYAPRASLMVQSLQQHEPKAELCALYLGAEKIPASLQRRLASLVRLEELLARYPELNEIRASRTRTEFIFTLTPYVISYFAERTQPDSIIYLDSDLYFYASPMNELGKHPPSRAATLVAHSFGLRNWRLARYGKLNVGLVEFNLRTGGVNLLNFWRQACADWCFDKVEGRKFADQGYLQEFEKLDSSVSIENGGFLSLGPWHKSLKRVVLDHSGNLTVDEERLVSYHFQGIKFANDKFFPGLERYKGRLTPFVAENIYKPYLEALWKETELMGIPIQDVNRGSRPWGTNSLQKLLFVKNYLLFRSLGIPVSELGIRKK